MSRRSRFALPIALTVAALALTGCGTGAPASSASATSTPTTPATTPTATMSPTPEPTAEAVTCETILTPAGAKRLADDGLTPREYSPLRTDLQFMLDAGGTACRWAKPSTDIIAIVAQAPIDDTAWQSVRTRLLAEGSTESDDPRPGFLLEAEVAGEGPRGGFFRHDGQLIYVSTPGLADAVAAGQD